MKKLCLVMVLVLALAASFAQTMFSATYTFGGGGNVQSFAYNGDLFDGFTMSDIQKIGITSTQSNNNFRGSNWPVAPSNPDPDKYIGFTMNASPNYTFTILTIDFGIGRSTTGVQKTVWRGSADNYAANLTVYNQVNAAINYDPETGVLTNPNLNSGWTGNILSVENDTRYQNLTQCGFRMHMFDAVASGGTGGLQGAITIVGTYQPAGNNPYWNVDPGLLTGLDYVLDNGPSEYRTFNIDGYNLDGYFMVSIPELSNFEIGYEYPPAKAPQEWGTMIELSGYDEVHHTVYARLKAGLPVNDYDEDVTVSYITQGDQGEVHDNKFVTLNGSVTAPPSTDPTWVVEPTELYGFTYPEGSGPSAYKTFTITGSNLESLFEVHAPSSGHYEISDNGDIYGSFLELFPVDGAIQQTVYVRLVAGLPQGDYTWYNNEPQSVTVLYLSPVPTDPIDVILGGEVTAPAVRYWVDFDNDGETKRGYAAADLVLSGYNWNLAEVLVAQPPLSDDWFEYKRSARFRGYGASAMTMLEDKPWGGGDISFKYRQYGAGDTQTAWVAEYSINQGGNWIQIGDPFTPTADVQTFTGTIEDSRSIRLRFKIANDDGGTDNRRWNLDSIDLSDYYDFFKDDPTAVGSVVITMKSNHANYNYNLTPGPVPVPDFQVEFHECLTLIGDGPWQIDTGMLIKQPDSYWAAYKLHNTWYAVEMVGGFATLNVPAGTVAANNEIELLIGYGKNPTVPVELSSFTATITAQNFVQLTWVSQSESNVMGYNVYRNTSDDLSSAIKISELIEGTNTSEAHTYTYLDQELEQSGTYYYWLENVDLDGTMSYYGPVNVVFSVEDEEGGSPSIPFKTKLENAYPNPFNPNTNIRYQLKDAGDVKIEIYNARGQLVRSFSQTHDAPGYYQINWDGRDSSGKTVSSGVYQYKMTSGKYHSTKKMVLKK